MDHFFPALLFGLASAIASAIVFGLSTMSIRQSSTTAIASTSFSRSSGARAIAAASTSDSFMLGCG